MRDVYLSVALLIGVVVQGQQLDNINSITFTSQARGYIDEVIITRDSVRAFTENHRTPDDARQYATGIDADRWARLILTLKDVPLDEIDELRSPTMDRAFDGAVHSSIVITFEDGTKVSHSFDDESPHPDLQPLMEEISGYRLTTPKHR